MGVLLIFLSSLITSYWAITDPIRLRGMAQAYLSDLIGGQVSVGSASLSLLEGLRLSDVKVHADALHAPDALVFEADAIDIGYDPTSLLRGRLEATRIVATGPHVHLVVSTATGRWNFQRLRRSRVDTATRPSNGPQPEVPLPQVVLRDAHVEYGELTAGRLVQRGTMDVEGRLFPSADAARYLFELQSRGAIEGVGPVVTGQVQLRGATAGQVDATLAHFRFGRDIEAMLPRQVLAFWQAHRLQGAMDIPEFRYTPAAAARPGTPARAANFHIRTRLQHVRLVIRPDELVPTGPATRPAGPPPPLIAVEDVTGEYLFDPDGVRFHDVRGTLLGNTISAMGSLGGYSPDAPVHLRLETPPDRPLVLPTTLPYLASLPPAVREQYDQIKPSGTGRLWVEVDRPVAGTDPRVVAHLTVTDGAFDSIFFPYPLRHATGTVVVRPDPDHGWERVDLIDVRGLGVAGGPNADRVIHLDGWVGPLDPRVGVGIHASGQGIASEPALFAAFPPVVRRGLAALQGPAGEPTPTFRGDFDCHVDMPVGLGTVAVVTADLRLLDGSGRLAAFPYPLNHLAGELHVRDGYVALQDVALHKGDTSVTVAGRVSWPTGPATGDVHPDLTLSAENVPLDDTLLAVLPPCARRFVRDAGVSGSLDVEGRVAGAPPAPAPADTIAPASPPLPVTYDLAVALRHGTARPLGRDLVLSDVTADLSVHPDRIDVRAVHGHRGPADLSATGTIDLPPDGPAALHLSASAHALPLDEPLRALLPPPAQAAWDALAPHGAVDADLTFAETGSAPPDYRLALRPRDVSVLPAALPYRLDHVVGEVTVDPVAIDLRGLRCTHGHASIGLTGHGLTAHPDQWDLTLSTRDLPVDADLRRALPAAVRGVVAETKFHGRLDLDLSTLNYRGNADPATADLDVAGTAHATHASLDVGVPLDHVDGRLTFAAAVRGGHVAAFRGDMDLDTLALAARPLHHLKAHLEQPAGLDELRLTDVQADVAGGRLAGRVDLRFAAADGTAASRPSDGGYAVAFAVTDADVATLAGTSVPGGQPIRGRLSASLDMQGDWSDPATRRGRGDVLVAGRDMYQIPLVLGLLEVTDLSLPTSSPFNQATARYVVDGRRVTFEQLQMRGENLVMGGNGWLDFGSKRVRMNFTTDNPHMAGLPVLHDLWQGAKQELLQIQVRGTVQDPQVSAASLHTFTTTVDEVFSGTDADR
jgi:hypothetical protein